MLCLILYVIHKKIYLSYISSNIFSFKDSTFTKSLGLQLLMSVYKGIAPGRERKALPSLDINSRRVADGLLQLAFCLSEQVSHSR